MWLVQKEFGWISPEAMEYVAELLGLSPAVVIERYEALGGTPVEPTPIAVGQAEVLREGGDVLIVGFGPIVMRGLAAAAELAADGWSIGVVNARFAKPLDRQLILDQARGKRLVVTLEESVVTGGFGAAVLEALAEAGLADESLRGLPVRIIGIPADRFVDQPGQMRLRFVNVD